MTATIGLRHLNFKSSLKYKGKRKVFTVYTVVRIHHYANGVIRQAVKSKVGKTLNKNNKYFKTVPYFY